MENFENNEDTAFQQRAIQLADKQMQMDGESKAFVVENSKRRIGYAGRIWFVEKLGNKKDIQVSKTAWTEVYTNEEFYKKPRD